MIHVDGGLSEDSALNVLLYRQLHVALECQVSVNVQGILLLCWKWRNMNNQCSNSVCAREILTPSIVIRPKQHHKRSNNIFLLHIYDDHVRNEEVLLRVNEQRNILHEIRKRKANWIGHILRRNCLLQQVIEGNIKGQIEVTRRWGRRRKKLLDDLKDRTGYFQLKEEALDRTMWRNRFGRGFGPVVWQITDDDQEKKQKIKKWEILRTEIKKCYILPSLHCSVISCNDVRDSYSSLRNRAWLMQVLNVCSAKLWIERQVIKRSYTMGPGIETRSA